MATGDTKERKDIPPGSKVVCYTCFDEKVEGEVLAFDYNSKFIVIKIPVESATAVKGSTGRNCHVKMLNISYLKDMHILEMATIPPASLPPLDINKIKRRINEARSGRQDAVDKVGVNVSKTAQKLFDAINKTFNEIRWQGECIVVMDEVTVKPPYKMENCIGKNTNALEHIKKLVKKYNDDEAKMAAGK